MFENTFIFIFGTLQRKFKFNWVAIRILNTQKLENINYSYAIELTNELYCHLWTGWYSYLWLPFIPLLVSSSKSFCTHFAFDFLFSFQFLYFLYIYPFFSSYILYLFIHMSSLVGVGGIQTPLVKNSYIVHRLKLFYLSQ